MCVRLRRVFHCRYESVQRSNQNAISQLRLKIHKMETELKAKHREHKKSNKEKLLLRKQFEEERELREESESSSLTLQQQLDLGMCSVVPI